MKEALHNTFWRWLAVALATALVSVLHFGHPEGELGLHAVHRELYFVPIILSAFWFGFRRGLQTALAISVLYIAGLLLTGFHHQTPITAAVQVFVFLLVAAILGWLAERQRRRQAEQSEIDKLDALGQAAAVLSHDIKLHVSAMQDIHNRAGGFANPGLEGEFGSELSKARVLAGVIEGFVPPRFLKPLSGDLNAAVRDLAKEAGASALAKGVTLRLELDPAGCQATADPEAVAWALDKIVNNAVEASPSGGEVLIATRRAADACRIEIRDQGPGIASEHMEKIFTPFFTTKPGGHGLALAGSRKSLRDLGGDILVESEPGKGATFTIVVPREGAKIAQGASS